MHHLHHTERPVDEPNRCARRYRLILIIAGVLVVVVLAWLQPSALLHASDVVGYAICHQIPERSFYVLERPLPLCARCTGTFMGALLGFAMIYLRRRHRCNTLPPLSVTVLLAASFAAWGADGLNSYLSFFDNAPQLYQPSNILRLTTGTLNGLALSLLVYPVFSFTVWSQVREQRSVESLKELGVLWLIAGLMILAVQSGISPLVYLLALLSVVGVLSLLLLVNTLVAVVLLRKENAIARWRDFWQPAGFGLVATGLQIGFMNLIRGFLEGLLGVPF